MKAGLVGNLPIRSSASCKMPFGSELASALKPIWLSLICTKLKSAPFCPSAAFASPRLSSRGTPPLTAQTRPVPPQARHFRTPRRLAVADRDLFITDTPQRNAIGRETGGNAVLFARSQNFRAVISPENKSELNHLLWVGRGGEHRPSSA